MSNASQKESGKNIKYKNSMKMKERWDRVLKIIYNTKIGGEKGKGHTKIR